MGYTIASCFLRNVLCGRKSSSDKRDDKNIIIIYPIILFYGQEMTNKKKKIKLYEIYTYSDITILDLEY